MRSIGPFDSKAQRFVWFASAVVLSVTCVAFVVLTAPHELWGQPLVPTVDLAISTGWEEDREWDWHTWHVSVAADGAWKEFESKPTSSDRTEVEEEPEEEDVDYEPPSPGPFEQWTEGTARFEEQAHCCVLSVAAYAPWSVVRPVLARLRDRRATFRINFRARSQRTDTWAWSKIPAGAFHLLAGRLIVEPVVAVTDGWRIRGKVVRTREEIAAALPLRADHSRFVLLRPADATTWQAIVAFLDAAQAAQVRVCFDP